VQDRQDTLQDAVQDTELVRLEIPEAAIQLGITPDGVRKRIRRGQLAAVKQDGRWYVVLDQSRKTGQDQSSGQAQDSPETGETDHPSTLKLVATLEEEVSFLRGELARRADETQQLRVIIAQLTERVPRRIEAPTSQQTDETSEKTSVVENTPQGAPQRPWWVFWRPKAP
jgi:hypothetical protein